MIIQPCYLRRDLVDALTEGEDLWRPLLPAVLEGALVRLNVRHAADPMPIQCRRDLRSTIHPRRAVLVDRPLVVLVDPLSCPEGLKDGQRAMPAALPGLLAFGGSAATYTPHEG